MKLSKVLFHIVFIFIIGLSVGGCSFPATESDDIDVSITRPGNGDIIMVGESFQIAARGSSTAGDVSRILYFANGELIGEGMDRVAGTDISADHMWTPTEPGQYTLQLAVQHGSEYIYSSTVNVCVLPFQIAPGHPFDIYAHGYEGDCVIPERSGVPIFGSPTVTTASASPQQLTYVPFVLWDECFDQTRSLSFKFYLNDPNDDVVFAAIAIEVEPAFFGRISSEATIALNRIGDTSSKQFVGRTDYLHIYLSRSLTIDEPGATGTEGVNGELFWTARAFGRDGEILIEEGPFVIPVTPVNCEGDALLLPSIDFPAPTLAAQTQLVPTSSVPLPAVFTLFRDAICRSGPSLDYKIAEYISNGAQVPVQARSADSVWLVVLLSNGVRCWVSAQLGNLDGDPNLLPVEDAPPIIATATPTNEGESDNENSCVHPSTCTQTEVYNGCNCVPINP